MVRKPCILLYLLMVIPTGHLLYSWSFSPHKKINRLAVFTLPPEMFGFYKKNIGYIEERAVSADRRRYMNASEAPRHYIDIDHYGEHPFDIIPKKWKDAVEKYTEDTLLAYGIVPWHIASVTRWLTEAFMEKNFDRILSLSADLGHYVADAHVPLHCTENYNGQFTGQTGIHGFWEGRLPDLFSEQYDFFVGQGKYIDDPLDYAWEIVKSSFAAKDSVLLFEASLNASFPVDQKYTYESRGQTMKREYSAEYSTAYHTALDGMLERRMRASVLAIGSYWYTAWLNAGKPELLPPEDWQVSEEFLQLLDEEINAFKKGVSKGRQHPD